MLTEYFLLAFLVSCLNATQSNPQMSRIIGGHTTDITDHPYHVFVHGHFYCGGSIVNENFIITAAHCLSQNNDTADYIRLRVGTSLKNSGGTYLTAFRKYVHPLYKNYDNLWTEYDVALIQLDQPLNFTKKIQPIRLPQPEQIFSDNKTCEVSGWGKTMNNQESTNVLRALNVTVFNQKRCGQLYEKFATIKSSMMCAGSEKDEKLRGPCFGDSGGGLICDGVLAGIVSWGGDDKACTIKNMPYVFAKVSLAVDWIKHVAGI